MIRSYLGLVLFFVVTLMVAVWLFMDASTFALLKADPEAGRARGCYTDVELMLGAKKPTEWVRPSEYVASIGLTILNLIISIPWYRELREQNAGREE